MNGGKRRVGRRFCGVVWRLPRVKVDLGEHAAGAAAAVGLDGIEGGMEDAVESGELSDLVGDEGVEGLRGHDEKTFAGAVVDLEHIAGEVVHLVQGDGEE